MADNIGPGSWADDADAARVRDSLLLLWRHRALLFGTALVAGLLGLGVAFLLPNTYLSRAVILPPQQQQSTVSTALSQLGALSGLVGAPGALKLPGDQYVALLQSTTVADRMVDRFDLMKIYDVKYRFEARKVLADNVRISFGKKDGLLSIEVTDRSPQRAADMANRFVEELRDLTSRIALTEAQQRRQLFEGQLQQARDQLIAAQQALQGSGFSQGALRTDARASAEGYARLRAEVTAAEVRLQALRRSLADNTPEVQQALSVLGTLRGQLARIEESTTFEGGPDYVSKFREFKYRETLFDLLARQYESARLDEAREGALVQVVDEAKPAEYKHRPQRALIAAFSAALALLSAIGWVLAREAWRSPTPKDGGAD